MFLTIAELSRQTQVKIPTIRYYETWPAFWPSRAGRRASSGDTVPGTSAD